MKRKILIMGFTKIKYMPYMNFYLDNIDRAENEVHLLYWNRDLNEEDTSNFEDLILHEFRCYQEDDVSKISKIRSFLKYRKFANRLLKENEYDCVFVLHSLTGVLVADILKKKYKNKFIFDYRDSTYEGIEIFKKIVGSLVNNSKATFVSSDAFRRFLPKSEDNKIFTSHNLLIDSLDHRDEKIRYGVSSNKIRIAFWGFIRHEEINKEIIKKISQDERFELHYYGREQQVAFNLKSYVTEIDAKNVFFHGEYKPEDRYEFVRTTDLIHNIYFDSNTMLAMGNKFYDGIIFRIPQLCMKNSFMGQYAVQNNVGIECNPEDENFTNIIFEYYSTLDKKEFVKNADSTYETILEEYHAGSAFIRGIMEKRNR